MVNSKLQTAKILRNKYGSITYYDQSIFFDNGKFYQSGFSCEGDLHSFRLTWKEVLKAIKCGYS